MFNKEYSPQELTRGLERLARLEQFLFKAEDKAMDKFASAVEAVFGVAGAVVSGVREDLEKRLDEHKNPMQAKPAAPQAQLSRVEKEAELIKKLREYYGIEPNVALLKSYGDSVIDDLYSFYVESDASNPDLG